MRALALIPLVLGCTPFDDGTAGREPATQGSADDEASCTELIVELELDADDGVLPLETNLGARISCEAEGSVAVGWDFGDGEQNSGAAWASWHQYAENGEYDVTLTITDNLGGQSSVTQTITVKGLWD